MDLIQATVTTLAGNGRQGNDKNGGLTGAQQELSSPWDVVLGSSPGSVVSVTIVTNCSILGSDHIDLLYIAMAGTHQIWAYFLEDIVWIKGK